MTILRVEQDVCHSLSLSDRGYVLEHGRVVMEGKAADLIDDPHIRTAYLGDRSSLAPPIDCPNTHR